jgi:hypothetical protein
MQIPINPLTNQPLPMGPNSRAFVGGRSLLDNIYGASSDPSIQANPPSRFRTNMMGGFSFNPNTRQAKRRTFTNRDMSQFVDPNIDNPLLRNYPALRKIPENQRQFAKIVDGKVVLDLPEEMEMGTQNQTENVSSEIPQTGFASQGQELASQGLLNEQGKQPTTGLLGNEEETKKETKGLLDTAKDFVGSTYGRNFAMGLLRASGYSSSPKTLGQIIGEADEYATNKALAQEKLDIERIKANKTGGQDQGYLYTVTDPNTGNTYNATWNKKLGKAFINIDGKKVPYAPDMFGGDSTAIISTAGNMSKSMLTSGDFFDLRNELETQENSLRKMADYLKGVQDVPSGMEKLAIQFSSTIKTILGDNDLTMEELTERINKGTFSSLIGANRLEVVGGGVMTEQDAQKIIDALGGDPSKLSTNPEVVTALISKVFADKYRLYNNKLEAYNIEVESGGYSKYKKKEPIVFNESQLSALDPNKVLELDLSKIADMSESQLGRINLDDLNADQLVEYEKRMKELGLL